MLLTIAIAVVTLGLGGSPPAHAASPWYPPPDDDWERRVTSRRPRPPEPERNTEDPKGDPPRNQEDRVLMTGTLDTGIVAQRTRDQDLAAISPLVRLGLRVRPRVELGLTAGAAAVFLAGEERVRSARPANLGLGGRWIGGRDVAGRRHIGMFGFEFALPLAFSRDGREALAFDMARAGRGAWNPWLWKPSTLAVVVPVAWSVAWTPRFQTGFEGAAAGLFSASPRQAGPKFAGQLAIFARVDLGRLGVELAARGVYDGDASDPTRLSVSPAADFALCRRERTVCPLRVLARLNVNIDAPYGFTSANAMRILGGQVGLGWTLRE